MTTVTTTIDIAAPPALVRSLFLDFPSLPQWHTGHFKDITVLKSAASQPGAVSTSPGSIGEKLAVGDKIRIKLSDGMSFNGTVTKNTTQRFVWYGGWSHVVVGEHSFQFNECTSTAGGTMLIHGETFSGGLVSLCRPFMDSSKHKTSPGFEKFNADIKKWAEQKGRELERAGGSNQSTKES